MKSTALLSLSLAALVGLPHALRAESPATPEAAPGKSLLGSATDGSVSPSSSDVTFASSTDAAAPGLNVTIAPGTDQYPGINIKPPGGSPWDLSAYGHITAKIVNTGTKGLFLNLRIDDDGDWKTNPWNAENLTIKPGATGTVTTIFGYSYGHKPAHPLKAGAVTRVLIFTGKSATEQTFRIETLEAAGPAGEKPPVNPASVRTKPKEGQILGSQAPLEAKQLVARNGAEAALGTDGKSVAITFPAATKDPSVSIVPVIGQWDLRDAIQVRVKLQNSGTAPVTPRLKIGSKGGATDVVAAAAPIAPGATAEIAANFAASVPWTGIKDSAKTSWNATPGTGTTFTSDAVGSVSILPDAKAGAQSLTVQSIVADVPAPPVLPDWVGKRPPVEGNWVQTFDEEFSAKEIDLTKWNIYAPNYWDQKTHFSKDNVLLGDGVAKLHYEKKSGRHNDDPAGKETAYACGYFDTYGKWVQRYGYFETRVKLPHAPGLWPAFWLMPDRGVAAGPQWKRSDTANGAMEFDIMEFLSRWGIYRFNIAMHWDGYGKHHQQTGSTCNYVQPDKDGFITVGLLWTPGSAIYYANGKEILRWESPRISSVPAFVMFDMVSGGWDNDQLDDRQLPDDFVVDYVRAWQRKDLASDLDGVKSSDAASGWSVKPSTPTPSPSPASAQPAATAK